MVLSVIILIAGFILLIKGADYFVEGSSSVAKTFQVPSMIIGLTIVAMGTSLPECAVSVTASLTGNNSLAVSNVVGSNIFNLMVVCGACALLTPLEVQLSTLQKEFPFSIICAVLLFGCGFAGMALGRVDGVVFLLIFSCYLLWMVQSAMKARAESRTQEWEEEYQALGIGKSVLFILCGGVAIKFGGDFVVDSATVIAEGFGLSETLIGLTIVSMGTSLPELVTSIVAAKKNEVDMALGNVIGSNIFNILLVLGVAASISPIEFLTENMIDIVVLVVFSIIVLVMAWTKQTIERKEGILMLAAYAVYMVYICVR